MINHYGSQYKSIPITYKIQNDPRGLVHAIECAAGAIGSSYFILMLADEVFLNIDLTKMIEQSTMIGESYRQEQQNLITNTFALSDTPPSQRAADAIAHAIAARQG